jgi:hypothetical protein
MTLTHHARTRMRQRGCCADIVSLAIDYGRIIHRQGFEFYCVAGKDLPERVRPADADRLKNLVVVCKDGVVVTTYRNASGMGRVKRKGKRI